MAAVLVQLERQDGHPRSSQGGTSYAQPIPDANRRVRATRLSLPLLTERYGSAVGDHTLLPLAVQTGLHLSELISLGRDAIHLGSRAHVQCAGKGRKERYTPLTTHARAALRCSIVAQQALILVVLLPDLVGALDWLSGDDCLGAATWSDT